LPKSASGLTRQIARRIAEHVGGNGVRRGERLVELQLAREFGVSRSPVREALKLLEKTGVVRLEPNRGYFVSASPAALKQVRRQLERAGDEAYMKIAAERLAGRISDEFTEADLMRRYDVSRAQLSAMLDRMALEGWVERKPGYGWRFLPVLQSAESHALSYRFRMAIEPAAILEPTFHVDRGAFAQLRFEQQSLVDGRIRELNSAELFDMGSRFHETVVSCSGNPFFLEALRRVDRLRRLIEYRAMGDPARFVRQAREHIRLLDMLEAGERVAAAEFLKRHLDVARAVKSTVLHADTAFHF
jgi:DNA-binding GntR family transcriptional regulator